MKLLTTILLISLSVNTLRAQDYESESSVLVTADGNQSMATPWSAYETNYISDNISSFLVKKHMDKVYISWNMCDDNTYSEFFIIKSTDQKTYVPVATLKNIPDSCGRPLLYCTIDSTNINKTTYYKLFKITGDGTIKHIITVLLPIPEEPIYAVRDKKKKQKLLATKYEQRNQASAKVKP